MSARRLAVVAVVAAWFVAVADAGAAPLVSTTPPLRPPFRGDTPDYTVRCGGTKELRLKIAAPSGTSVAVGSRGKRGGDYGVTVALAPGQQLPVRVSSGSRTRTHHIRCVPNDFPRWRSTVYGAAEAGWYIVSPIHLGKVAPGYTVVLDRRGVPVWWMREKEGAPVTGTLLPDGGIAWFPSRGTPFSIDKIKFEEHALDGSTMRKFSAVGTPTDHHELQVLPNRHALVISYTPRDHVDLRPLHPDLPSDATVVDCEVQEVDRKGKVKWRWSTWGHVSLKEAARWHTARPERLRDGRMAYDIAHMNSIDMHGKRVIVSLRHTDAVYEIDKPTGKILWKLGGTRTQRSLTFVGDPFRTESFAGQHDARLSDDGNTLTLFDNGTLRDRPSRAVRYSIDRLTRTATLIESVQDPAVTGSICCGDAHRLPGGHWVINWGGNTLMTETDSQGRRVFALAFRDNLKTYRADPILPDRFKASDFRRGMDAQAPTG